MKIDYENTIEHSYMVMKPDQRGVMDSYQLRMIKENSIPHFLGFHSQEKNGEERIYYEITSKESIEKYFRNRVIDYENCKNLLLSLQNVLWNMQEYLLDGNRLCLDEKMIFTDGENGEYCFVYLWKKEKSLTESFRCLSEYMLEKADYEDQRAVQLTYHFYKEAKKDSFSFMSIVRKINELEECVSCKKMEIEDNFIEPHFEEYTEDVETEAFSMSNNVEPIEKIKCTEDKGECDKLIKYLITALAGGVSLFFCCITLLLPAQHMAGKLTLFLSVVFAVVSLYILVTRKEIYRQMFNNDEKCKKIAKT